MIHETMVKVTGGRLGWSISGMPVVKLTTTGRRSGRPRTVMLSAPHTDGDTLVLVASKAGADHHPAWFLNLRENPEVTVETRGTGPRRMTARVASDEERAELWPAVTAKQPAYGRYQDRTEREIPLVLLEPAD